MNAIIITSIGRKKLLNYCLPSVENFASKYNVQVKVIDKAEYNLPHTKDYNYNTFEKFQVQKYLDDYDRILRLDVDVIFSPECPNLFELFDPEKLWAVNEDTGNRMRNRRKQINIIQNSLGHIDGWKRGYFNSGIVLTSKKHADLYRVSGEDIHELMQLPLGSFKEQNVLNWRAMKLGYEKGNMQYKFNHMSKHKGDPRKSYIVHVAGNQRLKPQRMSELYNYWYK